MGRMERIGRAAARPLLACGVSLAALTLLALLVSCSGTSVSHPVGTAVGDTYVRATFTLVDIGTPCTPLSCPPDYYDCTTRAPYNAGQTWTMHADAATAGLGGGTNLAITGTDESTKASLALALKFVLVDNGTPTVPCPAWIAPVTFSGVDADTWADVNVECHNLNQNNFPESRFHIILGSESLTITEADYSGPCGGSFAFAQPDGSGGFSPSGILAGTFSFDAIGLQTVPTAGSIGPVVHVDGCFRVNLPTPEMGVPVTPSPAAPACS